MLGQITRKIRTTLSHIPVTRYVWSDYDGEHKLSISIPENHDPEFEIYEKMTVEQFKERLGVYASEIKEM